jgi:hypothetical protein
LLLLLAALSLLLSPFIPFPWLGYNNNLPNGPIHNLEHRIISLVVNIHTSRPDSRKSMNVLNSISSLCKFAENMTNRGFLKCSQINLLIRPKHQIGLPPSELPVTNTFAPQ